MKAPTLREAIRAELPMVAVHRFSFGRPPSLPLARAASAFAALVRPLLASPPRRPSATACWFLRGIGNWCHVVERTTSETFFQRGGLRRMLVVFRSGAGFVLVAAVEQWKRGLAGNLPQALNRTRRSSLAVNEEACVLFHALSSHTALGLSTSGYC